MRTLYVSCSNFFQVSPHLFGFFLLGCWLYGSATRAYSNGFEPKPTALFALAMWRRIFTSNAGIPEYILPISFRVPHTMSINISAKVKYGELCLAWRGS